ncbi:MarR family transcriptional regulator [Aquisalimonas asiatica]|uniref:MarR family transcriptional regulator, transcriptional regulator for hemolysin n=1 Tax=Aquisalimonas asiatica TaxID=406100 RepID=A0A1H8SRP4_9GAMM|nr:MarR family transcriptional regulator [Aquisalimonas asiatica]SEO80994.1 MarR family transcriptional regulator, transcriptional regulator for hemolysin [Aquisalimonas asiatica]
MMSDQANTREDNFSDLSRLGSAIAETARVLRMRLDERLRPLGLSQSKWRALLNVWRSGEGLTQKALTERLGVEGPSVVGLLDRLAADGWIERLVCSDDRRVRRIYLTDKARTTVEEIEAVAAELRGEILDGIPEQELWQCLDVLRRIRDQAERLG